MDEGVAFGTIFSAAMVYLPAMWIMIGIAVLLTGFAPKLSGLTWLYLTYSILARLFRGNASIPGMDGKTNTVRPYSEASC